MARDRSRDQVEFRVLGLSALLVGCMGGAYGGFMEPCIGAVVGGMVGAVAGLIVSPFLVAAVGESSHPLVLPYFLVPGLITSLLAGWVRWEWPAAMLTTLAVHGTACLTAGRVFREKVVPAGHCRGCGYDMRGVDEPRCPECGWRRVVRRRAASGEAGERGDSGKG